MKAYWQIIFLTASIALAYWWLHTPALAFYSLQVFSLSILAYFALKFLNKAKIYHLAPATHSLEMVVITFAFLLLIGATGSIHSPLFPLVYLLIFFLVFSSSVITSIVTSSLIVLFFFGLGAENLIQDLAALLVIPLMLFLFLLSKRQHEEAFIEKQQVIQDEAQIIEDQGLLSNFLLPKLTQVKNLSQFPEQNKEAILGQIMLIEIELQRFLKNFKNK